MTGAGISTKLDIPDFHSENGMYSIVKDSRIKKPEDVFHKGIFEEPSIFYSVVGPTLARTIGLGRRRECTQTHAFISLLQEKGKLLTNYTQNFDGFKIPAGTCPGKLIQCHGSLRMSTCRAHNCGHEEPTEHFTKEITVREPSKCPNCSETRKENPRKGSKSYSMHIRT